MATITITIKDDLGLSENEIFDKIEDCVEYELGAADYEINVDI